ncbi:SiaB family protein kinase [Flammeovirgaceae bacterium SG7u.111]|nr:SiaB family protein kinase [Flammeovirgaceae bacterium SG7u.132]WPO35278.1 SiaB family protein kinase [Flammeovirgaceae bacterium SG7u.111]
MDKFYEHFSVKQFRNEIKSNSISMAFQGAFSKDILSLIAINLKKIPNSDFVSKKIFALVVEMAQNVHHYSAKRVYSKELQRDIGIGILTISENDDCYIISSGNYIYQKDGIEIDDRFAKINHLSSDELKELYKKQRKQPQRKDKPGANLGFIDMRRKSGHPLDYMIKKIDENESFFILSVKINKV